MASERVQPQQAAHHLNRQHDTEPCRGVQKGHKPDLLHECAGQEGLNQRRQRGNHPQVIYLNEYMNI